MDKKTNCSRGPSPFGEKMFCIFCHLHRALGSVPPQIDLAKGITAQPLQFYVQTALDHGAADAATTLLPWEDPILSQTKDAAPPDLTGSEPFAGFAEAREIAAAMACVRDTAALTEAMQDGADRPRRRRGGKGKEADPATSKPDWKS